MAIEPEELEPLRPKPTAHELETLGIDELETYIAELEREIERARATIQAKQGFRTDADSVFKA